LCEVEATSLLKALMANSFVLEDLYYRNFIQNYCYIMKTKSFLRILNTFLGLVFTVIMYGKFRSAGPVYSNA